MKKRKIRVIAIFTIGIICIIGMLSRINIEPADYGKSLQNQVNKAEKLLNGADVGNDNGEYSKFTVQAFQQQINEARSVLSDKGSVYESKKAAYKALKGSIENFKESTNKNCLSNSETENLIKDKKLKIQTIELSKYQKLQWYIDGAKLNKAQAINLEVRLNGPYDKLINTFMEKFKMQGQIISFYHNGNFPGSVNVNIDYTCGKNGTVYLYKYDSGKKNFIYISDAQVIDKVVNLTVNQGGEYIILVNKLEYYTADKDLKNISAVNDTKVQITKQQTVPKVNKNTAANKVNSGNTVSDRAQIPNKEKPAQSTKKSCTIEIRCDTLAKDLSMLTNPNLKKYVPSDGTILPKSAAEFSDGETVYDVLSRACRNAGIHMESRYTPMYGSYYIEGINHLYEFDGGKTSGWMYKVNGKFPNYGCSAYKLKGGEEIVWVYTCDLGKDVGDNSMSN